MHRKTTMITSYGDSKIGLVRKKNEDSIYVGSENNCFLIADGMGGYKGGQLASSLAVCSARDFLLEEKDEPVTEKTLVESIQIANSAVLSRKENDDELKSMGTTMIAVSISDNHLYWAHVGDSRLYIYNGGALHQITVDHSFVMHLVTEGKITKEEMKDHPRKNEITRAVGITSSLKVDSGNIPFPEGSLMLLCSDGLSNLLSDEEIASIIGNYREGTLENAKACVNALIEKVYERGASDNVSAILAYNGSLKSGVNND